MLLILTGDIQIGKTRWLERCADRLERAGVVCHGVLAPGVWRRQADGSLDKLGIDNLLLPTRETVRFAVREDLARSGGTFDASSQAARAQLAWHISDEAIERVNRHFAELDRQVEAARDVRGTPSGSGGRRARRQRALLVVDELGQLELLRNGGLTEAVRMLEAGPRGFYAYAIVVVRDKFGLVECAEGRFADAWDGSERIAPAQAAWDTWLAPLVGAAG